MTDFCCLPSVQQHCKRVIDEVFNYVIAQGDADYIGENVSQLQHSLQCASLAKDDSADEEVVLAALLHDIGRFIPAAQKTGKMIWDDGSYTGVHSHEVIGEHYLRQQGFSERICQLVGAHVSAKRYLTAVDHSYYDSLSETSKRTLKFQGGPLRPEEVKEAQKDPWITEKLAVRRWDDLAKKPDAVVPSLESYRPMAERQLSRALSTFTLHSRRYRLPSSPLVIVCIDGFDPTYLEHGLSAGSLPNLASFKADGFYSLCKSAMPSFTNTNNVSILTGTTSQTHGIVGNFMLDRKTGHECMIQDDSFLRGSTILEQMCRRGVRVAAVTAKEKLRRIIGHGLSDGISLSAEKANELSAPAQGIDNFAEWMGKPAPSQYSADLSLYVLDAGIKLLKEDKADLLYLTLSDFVQHKYAPKEKEAQAFMTEIDNKLGALKAAGAIIGVTGDHGMNDKSSSDGSANIIYLEDELSKRFGEQSSKVICPISDPYTKHHGGLGSFARVYVKDVHQTTKMLEFVRSLSGVEQALERTEAAAKLETPVDLEADLVVIATSSYVVGSRELDHDISTLDGHRLRSHGGLSEQTVPILTSTKASTRKTRQLRNFDIFHLLLGEQMP